MRDCDDFVLKFACGLFLGLTVFMFLIIAYESLFLIKEKICPEKLNQSKCKIKKELACKECKND